MKRIMVIGCCGAGKSRFAREFHSNTNIELFHLDQFYWKPNWEECNKVEWEKTVKQISEKDQWIIDGNYGGTIDVRIERADTIIYLDYSTITCLWRVTKRIFKYHGKKRPDMPIGCNERFDFQFYLYVAMFNFKNRPSILKKLGKVKNDKSIIIFKSDIDSENYLDKLR